MAILRSYADGLFLDAGAVATWMVPTGMTRQVHEFDPGRAGHFESRLLNSTTDTFHGRFVKLVPNQQVVEVVEFETADATLVGEMKITITLSDANGGTDIAVVYEGLPPGLSTADNETGWRLSLANLAGLLEAGQDEFVDGSK